MARRILLFITDLEIGGTPTVVRELAMRLNEPPGVIVEVACLATWGPVADQLRDAGIMVHALGCNSSWQLPLAVRRLVRLIRDRQFDTVFSFLIHANAVAAGASRFCRGINWLQSIQTTQPRPRWHWRLQRLVSRAASRIVVPSESTRQAAIERSAIPAEMIEVISNAIDPDAFPRSPVPIASPVPYPIGFIGRLDPIKRIDTLIRSIAVLRELKCPVTVHIYGDGPLRDELKRLVELEEADSILTFHGSVPRPQDAFREIGALVLPSEAEGFGLVLIEAMAAGVPVIANKAPGTRDVIRDGVNGVFSHGDPWSLAHAIARVIGDTELRDRLIENGLRDAREKYSWNSIIEQYRRVLNRT